MPETFITLPDGKRVVTFETSAHPDISGVVTIPLGLKADIPTYQVTAEGVTLASGKNLLSVFNNLPSNRIRIQEVYAYPRTSANNAVTIQLGYINSIPSGGSDALFTAFAVDFPANPAPPDNVVHKVGNTLPAIISGIVLGGNRIGMNTTNKYNIFTEARNGSAMQLRPNGVDGITIKQVDGGSTGTLNCHVIFTLD